MVKIYIAQLNPTIGALESNKTQILEAYRRGIEAGAEVVMFPELAVTGYPPCDLLERKVFVDRAIEISDEIAAASESAALIFGTIEWNRTGYGKPIFNVAVVAQHGKVIFRQRKSLLPTYDVFDELRHFEPAHEVDIFELCGRKVGLAICEDFWFEEEISGQPIYKNNPIEQLIERGAEVLLNVSASPFNLGKRKTRYELFREIALRYDVPIVYANQVGGNDELLFDGSSIVINRRGQTVFCAKSFETDEALVSLDGPVCDAVMTLSEEEQVGRGLILGLSDYLRKSGFTDVVIGLSGGIDSAVTAAIAVEAIGSEHVTGIGMPSRFSSQGSIDDAAALASNLGIRFELCPIDTIYQSYRDTFDVLLESRDFDLTDENVQARIRGNLLMAWSNKKGAMVVSTGNKSEMAVGYCTLYGDMAGGLAILGDVYKTTVYRVARWLNRERAVIPESSITKAPSAELRPNQTDQDSLPPYEILDEVLKLYIEQGKELEEIVARGFDHALVARVLRMVDGNEFKRRQAAPTIRVSAKAFGNGRQMPIAQRWRRE